MSLLPLAILVWTLSSAALSLTCYSCANDFMVLNFRHFFMKRNYGLTEDDPACVIPEVNTEVYQSCHSTCFALILNGTSRKTGVSRTFGAVRGCSSQYMTEEQHLHIGLGTHIKPSGISKFLHSVFDEYDFSEYWCYCAGDYCNTNACFRMLPSRYRYETYYRQRSSVSCELSHSLVSVILFLYLHLVSHSRT